MTGMQKEIRNEGNTRNETIRLDRFSNCLRGTAVAGVLLALSPAAVSAKDADTGYPYTPVPFTSVKVTDDFWGQRLKASREVTIPLAFSKCEETGRYENFVKAANPNAKNKIGLTFDDTDVYKTIEGASYSMQTYPDEKLVKYIDDKLLLVAAAQEPDGYLYTARTMNPENTAHRWVGSKRWEFVEHDSHEFYNLGHMIEGAIAHYQATGKRNFLDIAIKYADCVEREIGDAPGKQIRVPGHQIAEMALAKLYLVTGEKKYLDLAKFFLDKRGRTDTEHRNGNEYTQSHKPVIEQDEAVGHAVRATYMYSGIADVAALTGDAGYIKAIGNIWENVVSKKLYITGGIGATHRGEAFGKNYELPNLTAYNETCAAIANVYWNHRLFLLHGDAKYYDVLERTLYNGLISGVSLDGGSFFYPNPLESDGKYKFNKDNNTRQPWFGCACCPSNLARFIPSLPGYVYAVKENSVYVNLFLSNTAELDVNGAKLDIEQTSGYPWNGDVRIAVNPRGEQQAMVLKVRIPGWARNQVVPSDLYTFADEQTVGYSVKLNGAPLENALEKGYFSINRTWKKGDVVEVSFEMKPRIVKAHPNVSADKGRVSFERGPIVYCAEWVDNDFNILGVLIPDKPEIQVVDQPELLHGIKQLVMDARSVSINEKGESESKNVRLTLIPYYAWLHRGAGAMAVWLPTEAGEGARLLAIEKFTVDFFQPGEAQSEKDHNFRGRNTSSGEAFGRTWQHARNGGSMTFEMKVTPDKQNKLVLTYWGGETGNRIFDIRVEGKKVGDQRLDNNSPGQFFDVEYLLDGATIRGKEKVTVTLQARPGATAGGFFGCRVLTVEE
ncbi:MAG: glycoside hydrolase family 127 protein [Kiritimatiellaeota bacterium]|nr:glycoside hydrolase family 127 protein [Kiritimatiellota bacterium]